MSLNDVSKRYAKALFAASKEANTHAQTLASLAALAQATNTPEVANFFQDPQIEASKKVAAVSNTMEQIKTPENVKNFVMLLMNRKRAGALPEIAKAYEQLMDEESGVTKGSVYSAKPLSADVVSSLEAKISNILKKKIVLKFKEDPSVIGGVVAKVGGWTFDDSLDLHLKKLKEELLNH
ncbi:MAG: F0F1 ATP synthase subunit delta [Bdellovibrionaceae bacterium]|nr:F0F1 ATP synthase subunit delta [Pseudobdellovibrionaceae bacterium]